MIYEIIVIVTYLVTGLVAEQCYTSSGGVYSAGSIYRNLKYCAFGCCGPALNRYCCPIVGPIVGICVGAIAFIVILIVIIVCCRKYSERQIRRRAEMKMHIGPTLSSRYDPPLYDTESNHVSSRQDYQIKSQSHHHTSSHRMYDEHDDDIDHRPNKKRQTRNSRYSQEENRHGSSHGNHREETGSSRKHRHDSRREYHSDDDRLNGRRDSHRERRRHRDDHDRERRHSRSRERYMDRSYDDDDFSDEERYRRPSRRSRYSDPPPYRERSQDFYNYDRSSHRSSRSRERGHYDRN